MDQLCVRYASFRSKKACFGVLEAHFAAEVIIVSLTLSRNVYPRQALPECSARREFDRRGARRRRYHRIEVLCAVAPVLTAVDSIDLVVDTQIGFWGEHHIFLDSARRGSDLGCATSCRGTRNRRFPCRNGRRGDCRRGQPRSSPICSRCRRAARA